MSKWKKIDTFKEDPGLFPNRPVLLLLEITEDTTNCLVDDIKGSRYVTMGHWYPDEVGDKEDGRGHWEYIGWDWEQDYFITATDGKIVGWQELPDVE
jgi:hypothetical protein